MSIKIDDDTGLPVIERGAERDFAAKRGKVLPKAQASWGARDGMGREHDPTLSDKILNEAER